MRAFTGMIATLVFPSPVPSPRVVGRLLPGRGEPVDDLLYNKTIYFSLMFRDLSEGVV